MSGNGLLRNSSSDTTQLNVDVCTFSPVITSSDTDNLVCTGDTITLTVTAGDGYYWSNDEQTQSIQFSSDYSNEYVISVNVDSAGCLSNAEIIVTVEQSPYALTNVFNPSCYGDQASVEIYEEFPAFSSITGLGTFYTSFTGTDTTIVYTVIGDNGCASHLPVTFVQPLPITITGFTMTPASCPESYDGILTVNGLSGHPDPYYTSGYFIFANSASNFFNTGDGTFGAIRPGSYDVTVFDQNFCGLYIDTPVVVTTTSALAVSISPELTRCVVQPQTH